MSLSCICCVVAIPLYFYVWHVSIMYMSCLCNVVGIFILRFSAWTCGVYVAYISGLCLFHIHIYISMMFFDVYAMYLPGLCNVYMFCLCHTPVMRISCLYQVSLVPLSCHWHISVILLPCLCNAFTVLMFLSRLCHAHIACTVILPRLHAEQRRPDENSQLLRHERFHRLYGRGNI